MPAHPERQTDLLIGVDVGGTFTDLVCWDGRRLSVIKIPSTPPRFEQAVIDAIRRANPTDSPVSVVHGSTVATNALLQRAGEPVAFITTEGFGDMLLIGRQNRPQLYALRVERPPPITPEENWFTIAERIDPGGNVLKPIDPGQVDAVIDQIRARGLRHVAVCLVFSFANPAHERVVAERCASAGLTVSLSSELLPEFREYERASTTAINASLRPVVEQYLSALESSLPRTVIDLRIMQSGGGTVTASAAGKEAAKLVLSGPAGGAFGAAFVAALAGFDEVISYDMGGTSTDVALILNRRPQWTTRTMIGGLPIGLPMFDIHTVGAGGGSIAYVDAGGALRVGPRSAGAIPGPACYGRGGTLPTVTDANLILGRIIPHAFLGGAMPLDRAAAERAVGSIATQINKSLIATALGIVRVAESNMAHAIRVVSSQRGHDPRQFGLLSFGGAGGLHACELARQLDLPRVIVPAHCGVLSALGMLVAPPLADASRTVVHLGDALDDDRLPAEFGAVSEMTLRQIPADKTAAVEVYVDARLKGQSHELKVRVDRPTREAIERAFLAEYERVYGRVPDGRAVEIVTLRVRRIGLSPAITLPPVEAEPVDLGFTPLVDAQGQTVRAASLRRGNLPIGEIRRGPLLIVDPEATTFVPRDFSCRIIEQGTLILEPSE
jgi:N-methylhydantoinase A